MQLKKYKSLKIYILLEKDLLFSWDKYKDVYVDQC